MLQAVRELLPVIAVFYVLDALVWVRPGHLLFLSRAGLDGRPWSTRLRPAGLRLVGLLPGETAYLGHRFLAATTSAGLFWLRRPEAAAALRYEPASFAHRAYSEIPRSVREGSVLKLGGSSPLVMPSVAAARRLEGLIERLRQAPSSAAREKILDHAAAASADVEAARARKRRLERPVQRLVWACRLLWANLLLAGLIGLPSAAFSLPLADRELPWVLTGAGVSYAVTCAAILLFARALRSLGHPTPLPALLTALLFLPATLHAPSLLGREVYADFDFLTVAAVLLDRIELRDLAAAELAGIEHALCASSSGSWQELWRRRRALVSSILSRTGLSEQAALGPPPRLDPAALAFCRVCRGEFRMGDATCPECGLPLVRFPPLPSN